MQAGHFAGIPIAREQVDVSRWPWLLPGPADANLGVDMATLETSAGFYLNEPGRLAIADFDGGIFHRSQAITLEHLQAVLRRVSGTDATLSRLHLAVSFTDRTIDRAWRPCWCARTASSRGPPTSRPKSMPSMRPPPGGSARRIPARADHCMNRTVRATNMAMPSSRIQAPPRAAGRASRAAGPLW